MKENVANSPTFLKDEEFTGLTMVMYIKDTGTMTNCTGSVELSMATVTSSRDTTRMASLMEKAASLQQKAQGTMVISLKVVDKALVWNYILTETCIKVNS